MADKKPPDATIIITDPGSPPGHDTPGHGSPSHSSSSSSSSAPKVDPVVAQKEAEFRSIYSGLWGEPPTQAYVEHAAKSGMNLWEFEAHERRKPEFAQTKTYKDQAKSIADLLEGYGI